MERTAKTALEILRDIADDEDETQAKVLHAISNTLEQEIRRLESLTPNVGINRHCPVRGNDDN